MLSKFFAGNRGLAALFCTMLAQPAAAATSTSSIAVSATVLASCSISAAPLAFGNYSVTNNRDASTILSVTCTNGTPYTVALDLGLGGASVSVAARKMTGPVVGDLLSYQLHSDAARTTLWGLTPGTDTIAGTGTGSTQTWTVYGRIPAGQNVAPGAYADTVLVTLAY